MAEQPIVYKATYSSVAVYELSCRNIAVMRRRDDGYVNATQILKVAEFGKAQRTRILEREVQTGIHEKIQGGYGKYQGTWIPLERGKELARRYEVFDLLSPLLLFERGPQSPPLAPKHSTATSYKPKAPREPKLTKKQKMILEIQKQQHQQLLNPQHINHIVTTSHPSIQGSSRARAFTGHKRPPPNYEPPITYNNTNLHQYTHHTSVPLTPSDIDEDIPDINIEQGHHNGTYEDDGEPYNVQLLRHFISGDTRVPSLLIHPPSDLDFNIIIDDEGHTSLHWAAAIGHLKIVKLLLHHGADIYRVNYKGQTALIRAVLFTNNFERRCFPHMLEMLRKTIFNIDKKDQTVFHHIASTAGWKGKVHAARYYMDCLMERIRTQREDLVQILNVQDVYGDTALTIAARIGNKKLVRLMVDTGANPQLMNEEGKTPQDYILELDGNHSLVYHHSGPGEHIRKRARRRVEQALETNTEEEDDASSSPSDTHLHPTLDSRQMQHNASPVIRDIGKVVDECINSYERDQEHKDQLLREAMLELETVQKRVDMANNTMRQLAYDKCALETATTDASNLQRQLCQVMEYTQMIQLRQFIKQHEEALRPSTLTETTATSSPSIQSSSTNHPTLSEKTSTLLASPSPSPSPSSALRSSSPSIPPSSLDTVFPSSSPATPSTTTQPSNSILSVSHEQPYLEQQWKQLVDRRQYLVKEILNLQARTPNKKYQDYKRLISMCCNVNYENVDLMLSPLLASFEQSAQDQ